MPINMKKTMWMICIAVNVQQESDYIDIFLILIVVCNLNVSGLSILVFIVFLPL